jgi:rhodanese-related sulfurtransferase
MFKRFLAITLLAVCFAMAGPVWSYDSAMAESYAALFSTVKGAGAGKALHLMSPEAFLDKVKAKEPLVVLDIRTPAETGVYSVTLPGSQRIPVSELFTEAMLAQIPTDKTVVVLCKSGTRAAAAGTALRHIGFDNVYILKGGFKALAAYMGPKEANTPPAPQAVPQPAPQSVPEPAPPSGSALSAPPYSPGWYPAPAPFPPRPAW